MGAIVGLSTQRARQMMAWGSALSNSICSDCVWLDVWLYEVLEIVRVSIMDVWF